MELVQGVLGYYGIESYGAETAERALELIAEWQPTLVIVDLNLPGLDGWSFLKRAKCLPHCANVPFVAITAYHSAEMAEQAIAAGFAAYFLKPIDATSFVRELEGIVNSWS
jgi:CheY-like chemotaxis protein